MSNKILVVLILVSIMLLYGCTGLVESIEGEVNSVLGPGLCPANCNSNNACVKDYCNASTYFQCVHTNLTGDQPGCSGNTGVCSTSTCSAGSCISSDSQNCSVDIFSNLPSEGATDAVYAEVKGNAFSEASSILSSVASGTQLPDLKEAHIAYISSQNNWLAGIIHIKTNVGFNELLNSVIFYFGSSASRLTNKTERIGGRNVTLWYTPSDTDQEDPICTWREGKWLNILYSSSGSIYGRGSEGNTMKCDKTMARKYDASKSQELLGESIGMGGKISSLSNVLGKGMASISEQSAYVVVFGDDDADYGLMVGKVSNTDTSCYNDSSNSSAEVVERDGKQVCVREPKKGYYSINYITFERRVGDYSVMMVAYVKGSKSAAKSKAEEVVLGLNLPGEELKWSTQPSAEMVSAAYWGGADIAITGYDISATADASQLVVKNNRNFEIRLNSITFNGGSDILNNENIDPLPPGSSETVNLNGVNCDTPMRQFSKNVVITYKDAHYGVVYTFSGEKPLVGICQN
jgi:hypothetical protein